MTRDEVLAMTDEQLRGKVCELMGWKKWTKNGAEVWSHPDQASSINGLDRIFLPNFLNDRAAAWELVDIACNKHGLGFMIERCSGETEWFASFYRNDDECWTACDTDESDTRATVRSFILAMAS